MGRLISKHFKADGLPKRAFETKTEAEEFLERQNQAEQQKAYRCDFCPKWHVGKKRN